MKYNTILVEENLESGDFLVNKKLLEKNAFPKGDLLIKVEYSSLNYKDCLAPLKPKSVIKSFPMVPGIDLAGMVIETKNKNFQVGDKVFVNGWGMGEKYWGGFSEYASVNSDFVDLIPEGFSSYETMAIGTAGYTSMLCILALLENGVSKDSGKILVTGATGGVSSVAIILLNKMNYEIVASTGKEDHKEYLQNLGATKILNRKELDRESKALEKEEWAGVIDVVGGKTLSTCLATTRYGGTVASTGLAGGMVLNTTVAPFILRGIRLSGVDSVYCPKDKRKLAWENIHKYIDLKKLREITKTVNIENIQEIAQEMLVGKYSGRIVIDVNNNN